MIPTNKPIVPVLLSGGTGSRLWPLSREAYPKQLLSLLGEKTLLQQTALRTSDNAMFTSPMVVANAEHRFAIGEQLREAGIDDARIILEPIGRNTAPAVAVAALAAMERDPDAIILATPVDHWIGNRAAFLEAVEAGWQAAQDGKLVLFGVRPTHPATGFGYIRTGKELSKDSAVHAVAGFVEKPDAATAEQYLTSGDYVWNSGIFLLPARQFIKELQGHAPEVLAAAHAAIADATTDLDFLRLDEAAFGCSPSISIDYAVMEHTEQGAVVVADFEWNDIGSWSALWSVAAKNPAENVEIGDVISEDSKGCYLRGEGPLVAALGVENLVITATPDVVLVTTRGRDQDVGKLVQRLKANGHQSATQTPNVHRPWGYYQSIHAGERFQVKRITVNPGAKLSLQKHYHRAEHWVVVNGTAIVTRDDEEILLRENESIFVPLGCMHRLENPGKVPLNLIEVQSGAYLGEDDIVRVQDIYARV